ncbi:hypothetical protein A9Q73_10380 [Bermanella sp. 47_1433_sub80_T6]|nr:hypothetical protein A9Q73_10380 [Bermanella sp. 47_1433_sub80_T6]
MINKKISRRSLVKSTATATAVIGVGMSMGMSASAKIAGTTEANEAKVALSGLNVQEQYVYNVLAKNFKASTQVGPKEISSFSRSFVSAHNGQSNLLDDYSGIDGEYQLVRQFVKSSS